MMIVCAFDVGVKNLGLSIRRKNDDDSIELIDYNLINLTIGTDNDTTRSCGSITKKNKICGKKASFVGYYNGVTEQYYCKTHKKEYIEYDYYYLDNFFKDIENCKERCESINKNLKICGKKAYCEINDKYYCNIHKKSLTNEKTKICKLKPYKVKRCGEINLMKIAIAIHKGMDSHHMYDDMMKSDYVIFENPGIVHDENVKSVSVLLFGYFSGKIISGCANKNMILKYVDANSILNINMYDLFGKYNDTDDEIINLKNEMDELKKIKKKDDKIKKKIYILKKKYGEHLSRYIVKNENSNPSYFLKYFDSLKKKDDVSDADLLAYSFLQEHKKVT